MKLLAGLLTCAALASAQYFPPSGGGGGGGAPTGPAGGVLTGTYPNPGITTLNQSTTGNAATATALLNPRAINGVAFDGTGPITVTYGIQLSAAPYYASCSATTTTTSGTVNSGATSFTLSSATSWTGNGHEGIYIAGAGAAGANYIGTVTALAGAVATISPATGTSVINAVVQHDDTAAFRGVIADITSGAALGAVFLPPGTCNLNAAFQDPSGARAIINMPNIPYSSTASGPAITIHLKGTAAPPWSYANGAITTVTPSPAGTVLQTAVADNTGSLFGAQNSSNSFGNFTSVNLVLDDLVFRTIDNPNLTLVNANNIVQLTVRNSTFDTFQGGARGFPSQPTHTNARAIVTPAIDNEADTRIEHVQITGFYTGILWQEHGYFDDLVFNTDWNAIVANFGGGQHAGYATRLLIQECAYGIAATGAGKIGVAQIVVEQLNIGGNWWVGATNAATIYDPSNFLTGTVYYLSTNWNGVFGGSKLTSTPIDVPAPFGNTTCVPGDLIRNGSAADPLISVVQSGQALTVTPYNTASIAANGLLCSAFNFTGQLVSVRVPVVVADNASSFVEYLIGPDKQNWVRMYENNGSLFFDKRVANSGTAIANITYSQSAMLFWRLSESGGTITAAYSPDGSRWTTLGTTTVTFAYTAAQTALEVITTGAITNPGFAQFDEFSFGGYCANCGAMRGVSGAISGALTIGACNTATVSIAGARNTMAVSVTPTVNPDSGAAGLVRWDGYVSANDVVTVRECGLGVVTPTSTTYQVAVIP